MAENNDEVMASVFKALADPTRRRLLDRLHADNGQTQRGLCEDLAITRQGITQHLEVLQAAGLVTTVRQGREKLHYLNPVPLHEIYERWIAKFEQPDLKAIRGLKDQLEKEHTMDKPSYVYATFIASTPERIWEALTDEDQTAEYWGHRNVSTWTKGSTWEHVRDDGSGTDGGGTIVEIDPPRRLVHTWGFNNGGSVSRVTYDLEPVEDVVKLTITHENLTADEYASISGGWPIVLASLKSFLETGTPLSTLVSQKARDARAAAAANA
jgi:uncharacterized protein YndB with AHSA1/START domain/DNA-binding transcriptional ArsR family regulator